MAYMRFRCHRAAACTCRNTGMPRGCTARRPLAGWSICFRTSSTSCRCSRWSRGPSSTYTLAGTPPCPALALAQCRSLQGEMDISITHNITMEVWTNALASGGVHVWYEKPLVLLIRIYSYLLIAWPSPWQQQGVVLHGWFSLSDSVVSSLARA